MQINIVNFYPFERNDQKQIVKGSLHVAIKLADNIELNIRGILASRQNDKWFFRMPFKNGTCHKTGNTVTYPTLSFTDQEMNKELLNAIYEKAPVFISNWLELNPQAVIEQKQSNQPQPPPIDQKRNGEPPIAKKPEPVKPYPTIKPNMQWQDPPARKQQIKKKPAYSNYR